jgi:putative dehydrogenase
VEAVGEAQLVEDAELILSVVPPASAGETAARWRPLIERSARRPTFIDCNAIAPQTLARLAEPFVDRGLPFGDGAIIGTAPRADGYSPRLYLAGPVARETAILQGLGLNAILLGEELGAASTLKMSFAGITKGCQAIGVSMLLGASRHGAFDILLGELRTAVPEIHSWLQKTLPVLPAKAYRWDGEMLEIARFLAPEEGASAMLLGAAALYRHVAVDYQAGPSSEIMTVFERFLAPPAPSAEETRPISAARS